MKPDFASNTVRAASAAMAVLLFILYRPATGDSIGLDGFYSQLDPYLARYHDPAFDYNPRDLRGNFSYQPGETRDLYGSVDMVYVLWTMNELESRTTAEGRAQWAAHIQQYQDPETGWFKYGNETMHFKSHATAYATGALALLGEKPLHPFKWSKTMTSSEKDMEKWLEQVWWWLVWVGSHEGGGVAAALAMTEGAPEEWFHNYLDWFDKEVNANTGLWQRAFFNRVYKKPTMQDMGGAAHFWWIYEYVGRPIPYPEKVIDTCLGLQLDSGLWDKKGKKGDLPYCIDLDAINGINQAFIQLYHSGEDYRGDDITRAYEKYLRRATGVLNGPGNIERLYTNSHDLPGALVAIAEANKFFMERHNRDAVATPRPWRSVLDFICWL